MKTVINRCYGGFGVSPLALKELVKRGAACIKQMTPKYYYGGEDENDKMKDRWEESWEDDFADYKDIGDGFLAHPSGFNVFKDGILYDIEDRHTPSLRGDVDLVKVVEFLGDKSFGSCAKLKIVEIPDGIEWEIDEYDGMEQIREVHRSWC